MAFPSEEPGQGIETTHDMAPLARWGATPGSSVPARETEAIKVVDPRDWDELTRQLGGDPVYHSLAYHLASATLEPEGTVPVLLHHRSSGVESALPLLLRPLPDGRGWDATSAYGFGGPISSATGEPPGFQVAVDEWAMRNELVASFVRYHPLLENERYGPRGAQPTGAGYITTWDLTGERDLMLHMHRHHRQAVRRADRNGLVLRAGRSAEDLAEFRDLYEVTMKRQNAEDFYYFPEGYWQRLAAHLSDHLLLVQGLLDGEVVASLLCLAGKPFLHAHLSASSDEGRRIGASNRVFLAAAEIGREEGFETFLLGGAPGGSTEAPLFVFKHRFDPEAIPRPYYVGKWVHDRTRYRHLAGGSITSGYFPPWRR
jgi:serine/alanine adding enzyme